MSTTASPAASRMAVLKAGSGAQFLVLAAANAVSVAALYWNQTIATSIALEFPEGAAIVSLVPFATLAGYAMGVAAIAFVPAVSRYVSIRLHLGFLGAALLACGLVPNLMLLILFSGWVGAGAAVAQRLLATAARLAGPDRAGAAIGATIAAALIAVLGVRLFGGGLAELVGWRAVLVLAAAGVAVPTVFARFTSAAQGEATTDLPRTVWCSLVLWRAAAQQAAVFAAYNAGWMTLLIDLPSQERLLVVIGGSGAGLLTAWLSGRIVDRFDRTDVARIASMAVAGAAGLLWAAYASPHGTARWLLLLAGMMSLDAGLQASLVANQARVQALLPTARGRLAALLTVFGALGGAFGAGAAYWMWHRSGWEAAIAVIIVASLLGVVCSRPFASLHGPRRAVSTKGAQPSQALSQMSMPGPAGMA